MNMKKGLKISSFFALKTVMNYVKKCCQNGTLKQLQDLSKLQSKQFCHQKKIIFMKIIEIKSKKLFVLMFPQKLLRKRIM